MEFGCGEAAVPLGLETAPTSGVEHRQVQSPPKKEVVKYFISKDRDYYVLELDGVRPRRLQLLNLRQIHHVGGLVGDRA